MKIATSLKVTYTFNKKSNIIFTIFSILSAGVSDKDQLKEYRNDSVDSEAKKEEVETKIEHALQILKITLEQSPPPPLLATRDDPHLFIICIRLL